MNFHEAFFDELEKLGAKLRHRFMVRQVSGPPASHQVGGKWIDVPRTGFELIEKASKKSVGSLNLKPGTNLVEKSSIDPKYRGLGLGRKLYGEAMRRLPGRTLGSDISGYVSDPAIKMWESRKRGWQVREASDNNPRKPLFTGSLPSKAALPGDSSYNQYILGQNPRSASFQQADIVR